MIHKCKWFFSVFDFGGHLNPSDGHLPFNFGETYQNMACVGGLLGDLTSRSHLRFNDGPFPFNFGETNLGMISLHFSSDHFYRYGFLVTNF